MSTELKTHILDAGYDGNVIVEDVNLQVKPGEVLALIGPNGAGKSTLLRTLTAQLPKIRGAVFLSERKMQEIERGELARKMALVTTERPRPEWMTCREMVAAGRYPYTGKLGILSDADWQIAEEALRTVQGEAFGDADYNRISDGQRQRIMLARALCQEPEVLVLDEPTSFLDIQFKMDLLSVIRRIAKQRKIGVILSMHELEFVPAAADRVACIGGGRVACVGTPEEVITGRNLEQLFGLQEGAGEEVARGIHEYAEALRKWIR